jgi:hypothetical protein
MRQREHQAPDFSGERMMLSILGGLYPYDRGESAEPCACNIARTGVASIPALSRTTGLSVLRMKLSSQRQILDLEDARPFHYAVKGLLDGQRHCGCMRYRIRA